MPQNQNSNYYDDSPSPDSGRSDGGADGATAKTAMLNKEVLGGGVSVGDTVTLKVVAVHGNEVEVSCCGGEREESEEPQPEQQEQSGGGMQSLLED